MLIRSVMKKSTLKPFHMCRKYCKILLLVVGNNKLQSAWKGYMQRLDNYKQPAISALELSGEAGAVRKEQSKPGTCG